LHRIAAVLVDRETIDADEVSEILHDVPKWEHTESGALRIKAPEAAGVGESGFAAATTDGPGST
jgi:hypothetical protein